MVAETGSVLAPAQVQRPASSRYAWYVVGILTVLYSFSFIARAIFSLLVQPIRHDLHISDTQVGILVGFSFAVIYTFLGIPLGRLADIYSRRLIIGAGVVVWSLFTAASGLAQTYSQILWLRMGVGAGEAALSPAAYSLIADYFPRKRLATAISVYSIGIYIGTGLSTIVGAYVVHFASSHPLWTLPWIGSIRSWQLIFFIVGLPGLVLVLLLYTIREPQRATVGPKPVAPVGQVVSYMFRNRWTLFALNVGFGLGSLSGYAAGAWLPEFYRRQFHWNIVTAGKVYGLCVAIFCSLGIAAGGWICDHLRSRGWGNANLLIGAVTGLGIIPFHFLVYLAPSARWATIWLIPSCFLAAVPTGIVPAAIQEVMPANMRAAASGLYLFIVVIIGFGLGPVAVGACTQYIFRDDAGLRYSLVLVESIACLLGAAVMFSGAKPFLASLESLRVWNAAHPDPHIR